jgi:plasmid stability protein
VAAVVIRNLPDTTHRALKQRAKRNGRSTEAEIREILVDAMKPKQMALGSQLAAIAQEVGGIELDIPPRTEMANHKLFE